jgi:hypothetical protein
MMLIGGDWMGGGYKPGWVTCYANGGFAASFDDGVSWEEHAATALTGCYDAAYGLGTYVFVGQVGSAAHVATAGDLNGGMTLNTTPPWGAGVVGGALHVTRLGLFVICGTTGTGVGRVPRVSTSPDGLTWTPRTLPYTSWGAVGPQGYNVICDDGTTIVMCGLTADGIVVWKSTDAVTWTEVVLGGAGEPTGIASNGSVWLLRRSGASRMSRSTDLTTWADEPPAPETGSPQAPMDAGNGLFAAAMDVGGLMYIYTSPTGLAGSWTQRTQLVTGYDLRYSATRSLWMSIEYGGTRKVYTAASTAAAWTNVGTVGGAYAYKIRYL